MSWAMARLPEAHRSVMAHARATYLGEEAERRGDFTEAREACAAYIAREIRRRAEGDVTVRG